MNPNEADYYIGYSAGFEDGEIDVRIKKPFDPNPSKGSSKPYNKGYTVGYYNGYTSTRKKMDMGQI